VRELGLAQGLLDARADSPAAAIRTKEEIEELLKKGAYHIFNNDDTENIDRILQRRMKTTKQLDLHDERRCSRARRSATAHTTCS
jgi:hypothetical protein